jgi:hypothetical protein
MAQHTTSLEQSAINACAAARTLVKSLENLDPDDFEAATLREILKGITRLAERQVRKLRCHVPTQHRDKVVNLLTLLLSELATAGGRSLKAN